MVASFSSQLFRLLLDCSEGSIRICADDRLPRHSCDFCESRNCAASFLETTTIGAQSDKRSGREVLLMF